MAKVEQIDAWFSAFGRDVVWALILLLVCVFLAGVLSGAVGRAMRRAKMPENRVSWAVKGVYLLVVIVGVTVAMHRLGFEMSTIRRLFLVVCLGGAVLTMVLRRYYPSMPFKAGDTVEVAGMLGQVDQVSVLNTRLKAFDGKTLFIPNRMILNDTMVNYHFTPTRQVRLVFNITYDSDLLKAKAALAEILAEDPRVLDNPPARVFVTELGESSVDLAARPWVKNIDYFRTRCDLLEKVKLRFDHEGIKFAFPQREIHLRKDAAGDAGEAAFGSHEGA